MPIRVSTSSFEALTNRCKKKKQVINMSNEKRKNPKRKCINYGRAMKQQFIGLGHCKCGMSWKKDIEYFERTPDMVFALERQVVKNQKNQ